MSAEATSAGQVCASNLKLALLRLGDQQPYQDLYVRPDFTTHKVYTSLLGQPVQLCA